MVWKKSMKKILFWIGAGLIIALLACSFTLDLIVARAIESIGAQLTGTHVEVGSIDVSLYAGRAEIEDLLVANPAGYKTPNALEIRRIRVLLPFSMLLERDIEVDRVLIEGPWLFYEMQGGRTNVRVLLDNLQQSSRSAPDSDRSKQSRRVVLRHLLIRDGKAVAFFNGPDQKGTEFAIPAIRLNDLGEERGGLYIDQAVTRILVEVIRAGTGIVTNPLGRAGKVIGETLKGVGEGLKGLFE